LIAEGNSCVTKASKCASLGEGCLDCSGDVCTDCAADTCCEDGKQIIINGVGQPECLTCGVMFDINCANCTSTECLSCTSGMGLEDGECKSCFELFDGCATCDSHECYSCSNPEYIHTANGCYYEEPEPEPQSSVHSGSSGSHSEQSKPLPTPSKSSGGGGGKGGMIAGIIIGVIVVVAIVAVAIYCVVTAGAKHGKIDPSIYEQDTEFESMSVL